MDTGKVAAARLWAATRFPYLASALFAVTVVSRVGLGGAAVDDRWRLYLDPAVADAWPVPRLAALLVHHTGHLLRDHAARAGEAGVTDEAATRWTVAADAELNDDLAAAALDVPDEAGLRPEDLGLAPGLLAEEYYAALDREAAPGGDEAGGDHGSGAHGRPRTWEEPGDGAPGLDRHEAALARAQAAAAILAERDGGDAPGTVPAGWLRWAEQLLEPRVDWRRLLAGEIRRGVAAVRGCADYSYSRPSRRATVSPAVVLPAMVRPEPEVAVVCDTSGSMSAAAIARVLAEVDGVLARVGVRGTRVLAVDAAVHSARRARSARGLLLAGGGGTDMGAGVEAAAALRPRPDVVVVLTDGRTPWPSAPPRGVRVVVGLVDDGSRGSRPAPPAWARVVTVDAAVA